MITDQASTSYKMVKYILRWSQCVIQFFEIRLYLSSRFLYILQREANARWSLRANIVVILCWKQKGLNFTAAKNVFNWFSTISVWNKYSLVLVISINFIMLVRVFGAKSSGQIQVPWCGKKKIFLPVLQKQVVGKLKGQKPLN